MGTKNEFLEEATKVKSPAEIDEMLRQARSGPSTSEPPPFHDADEFEAHTQIGQLSELARQSLMIEDPAPPPVMPRASSANVIRRATSPHAVVRASNVMAAVPDGSLPEMPKAADDESAFDQWDDFVAPAAAEAGDVPAPPIAEPTPIVQPIVQPSASEAVVSLRANSRWGVVAWVVLLLAMIGTGTMGYLRIAHLEDELAMTKAALDVARIK